MKLGGSKSVAGALLVLLAATGCSSGSDASSDQSSSAAASPPASAKPSASITVTDQACAPIYEGAQVATVMPDTEFSEFTVCMTLADGTKTQTVSREESEEMVDSLAGLLAEPSSPTPSDVVCTAEVRVVPDFVVVTSDGTKVAPVVPTDECSKPSAAVVDLLTQAAQL